MTQKYFFSVTSLARLNSTNNPLLIDIFKEAIKQSPIDFGIPAYGGGRTQAEQNHLYAIGRTIELDKNPVTWTLNSNHILINGVGYAVDFYPYVNGHAVWNNHDYFEKIARHIQFIAASKFNNQLDWGYDLWGKD